MKKIIQWLKDSMVLTYIRDLSIVIIGVLITLTITDVSTRRSKQKEIKEVMGLIKTELWENLDRVCYSQKKWETEQRIYHMLQSNINDIEEIHADTLNMYRHVIGDIHSIHVESGSYEVFKSSLLMQYMKDKDLLRQLAKAYNITLQMENQLARYSEMKENGTNHLINNMSHRELKMFAEGDVYDFFLLSLEDNVYKAFVYTGGSIVAPHLFEECKKTIISTIDNLDKQGY